MRYREQMNESDLASFEPDAKVGVLATVNEAGLPHLTLITSLKGSSPTQLTWGQFIEGQSKAHVLTRPKTSFMVMTLDRRLWLGRAVWTGSRSEGPEWEAYNQTPMFRYNAYFGIHTVHYMDLLQISEPFALPLPAMLAGHGLATALRPLFRRSPAQACLKPWAGQLLNKPDSIKVLSFVGPDGFPELVPAVPVVTPDRSRLLIAPTVSRRKLAALQPDTCLAVFAMSLQMESVLIRGRLKKRLGPTAAGLAVVEIDWVYNSMPPIPGQIYPPRPLEALRCRPPYEYEYSDS